MRFLRPNILQEIYFKGVLPSVLYAIPVWGNCSPSLMEEINSIHVKAARFVRKVKKSVIDHDVLTKADWHPICWYYKRRVACIIYQLYHNDDMNFVKFDR
jgi:hypothetical protein